jgi:hypothetical protein
VYSHRHVILLWIAYSYVSFFNEWNNYIATLIR